MAEIERGRPGIGEERLPWLEAVEDEDAAGAPGAGRLVAAVLVALVAIGLVVGGVFWMRDRARGGPDAAPGELIAAPAGPYKVKPDQPGGMQVEGQGETAYAASEGTETNTAIDLNALPEAPMSSAGITNADAAAAAPKAAIASGKVPTGPAPASAKVAAADATPAKPAATKAAPAKIVPAKPEPVAVAAAAKPMAPEAPATGGTIQLGAFSSEAKANAAWKTLSGRFAYLAPLSRQVVPVKTGTATLYRLRATAGAQAATICGKLKVAGETCARIGS